MSIHILPPEVASQIAAGEVVERPASVVKELVENALDAGARIITINIREAGRRLIEVSDDGNGIPFMELHLAVSRHATSKLDTADDLFHINTLGFRGEALAAIGSVSRMTITSQTAGSPTGGKLYVEGGKSHPVEKIATTVGSVVRVEDLFFNVPARLKFLKQDVTERRAIDNLLTRYALAYPQVRFRLMEGEKTILQTNGDNDRRAILAAFYGVEVAKQMLDLQAEQEEMRLTGFISPTSLTRSNRKEITFFVNGRWIQDIPLTAALLQAYHTLLMVGRYPLAVLFLEVQPSNVDVNVHPAKAEIRFRQPDQVFSFVQRAVRRAILAHTPVPAMQPHTLWGRPAQSGVDPGWQMAVETGSQAAPQADLPVPPAQALEQATSQGAPLGEAHLPLLRLIGQVGAAYLVAEAPDGLYLIDQHAAHERVLFEKFMAIHRSKRETRMPSQTLLSPASLVLPPAQATLLSSQLAVLEHLGFTVEPFGPNTFQVRAVPGILAGSDPGEALRALVEDFEEDEAPLQAELEARIIARVCKRAAIKAGQVLSSEEQRALLDELETCESPRTCPHGRPTMIHLSVDMLERQFGRRGAR